jgi:hypothetical protein
MSAVGSANNVQYGFEVADTSLVTVGGTSVGLIDGGINIRVPRTYSPLRADQYHGPIKMTKVSQDVFVSFTMKEVLGGNLVAAWDGGAYASSSAVVNTSAQGEVAVVVNVKGPDGSTRTITISKAYSIGDAAWSLPFAAGQTIEAEFQAVADVANAGRMLASVDS